ncbi:MAG TPA: Rieske 2Fe-2S domain-containing protein [Gaiellales bacterium]|nr:Rieske 2Fe-2S domain-containing protein [Gaiellales bacterium]
MAMTATSRSEAAVLDQGCVVVSVGGQTVALFADDGVVRAVDNRCPHMGFPLHRGSVCDGILTCHWHHARFDLASGGTLDQWADDVPAFPVEIRDGEVFVDVAPQRDERAHRRRRLRDGLERNISLVIAKSAIALTPEDTDAVFEAGLEFGVRASADGWGQGLTILTALRNLLPLLEPDERAHALHHGLAAVASDCDGMPPRHPVAPLPSQVRDADTVERWFRRCVEVRDAEGAERAIASAVRGGEAPGRVAAMLYAAATDHRYLTTGHVLDFTTKSLEALDHAGWAHAEVVLGSLARLYAEADRAEESNQWRSPVDLVAILDEAFALMPEALAGPRQRWTPPDGLTELLLGDEPRAIAAALLDALRAGAAPADVAAEVTYAAAMRIARFPVTNEFTDWDTALHTFTFANAVEQGLLRTGSAELVRGVFDAAMSVFLDRFLNTPPARLPNGDGEGGSRDRLFELLDRQQQVDAAGSLTAGWLDDGDDAPAVISALVTALLREDRNFHTIQMIEAAVRQHGSMPPERGRLVLIAGARYLAAHAPTARAQTQTYRIAWRLNRGETLFE